MSAELSVLPYRKTPLVTGHIYHAYNQGIDRRLLFTNKREYQRALQTIRFYIYRQNFIKLSRYLTSGSQQLFILKRIRESPLRANLLAYCLMPNHFHFVIKQVEDKGISQFLADFQNSYTKYFNAKHKRKGSLLLNPFRAVRIETDKQLIHVVRYVHLNPYSSAVITDLNRILDYPYSSMKTCINQSDNTENVDTQLINNYFKDINHHQDFVLNQADYQKHLENIKHLTFEDELDT